jgi:hypothetical protein
MGSPTFGVIDWNVYKHFNNDLNDYVIATTEMGIHEIGPCINKTFKTFRQS